MNKLVYGFAVAAALAAAGCATEQTRRIARGEDTEVTSGFAEADLNIVVSEAVQGINKASARYAKDDARRVVNVKPFTVDTTARGAQAYEAELARLRQCVADAEAENGGSNG